MESANLFFWGCSLFDLILNSENELEKPIIKELVNKIKNPGHLKDQEEIDFYKQIVNKNIHKLQLGGSSLNTARIINHLLPNEIKIEVIFISSLGYDINTNDLDLFSKNFMTQLENEKMKTIDFINKQDFSTCLSSCIPIIESYDRTFYNEIYTSSKISIQFMKEILNSNKINYFYSDIYLLEYATELYEFIYKELLDTTILIFNLANVDIFIQQKETIFNLFPYFDIIICNEEEFKFLEKCLIEMYPIIINNENKNHNYLNFHLLPKKNIYKKRIIINTRGDKDSYAMEVCYQSNTTKFYNQSIIEVKEIEDFNGAGDSFAGGFLTLYLLGYEIQDCLIAGNILGSECIKKKGFNLPNLSLKEILNRVIEIKNK